MWASPEMAAPIFLARLGLIAGFGRFQGCVALIGTHGFGSLDTDESSNYNRLQKNNRGGEHPWNGN